MTVTAPPTDAEVTTAYAIDANRDAATGLSELIRAHYVGRLRFTPAALVEAKALRTSYEAEVEALLA